jgi:hypothetical protein
MPYKKKEKISLLLYYDYIEQFELLNDEQLRKLIYAMVEFDKNQKEEKLDKMTKMAFVPIKRRLIEDRKNWEETCKKNSENANKRWEKKYATACDSMPKYAKYADIDKEKDKEIEKDKEKEWENINISANAPTPTLSDILIYSAEIGFDDKEYCENFYNHYEAIGWVNGSGQKIKNWKLIFNIWLKKDKKEKKNEEEYIDEAGFVHRNGRRIL